jgi:hypothetical protein
MLLFAVTATLPENTIKQVRNVCHDLHCRFKGTVAWDFEGLLWLYWRVWQFLPLPHNIHLFLKWLFQTEFKNYGWVGMFFVCQQILAMTLPRCYFRAPGALLIPEDSWIFNFDLQSDIPQQPYPTEPSPKLSYHITQPPKYLSHA